MAVVARFNNQLKLDNNSETSALAIDAQQLSSQLTGRGNRLHNSSRLPKAIWIFCADYDSRVLRKVKM